MSVTEVLFRPLLAGDRGRPLITHYDDTAGSRVELSVATVANWAAKAANWLTDELDVGPGTPVAVSLPAHWQTAGVLLGAWWCGAHVTDEPAEATVAFVPPSGALIEAASGAETRAVVSLHPMGGDLGESPPPGTLDYVAESRVFGDDFPSPPPVSGDSPALLEWTVDEAVAEARRSAESLGLTTGTRLLSTVDWTMPEGLVSCLLAVLAGNASLVQSTTVDRELLAQRRAAERTTVDLLAQPAN